MEIHKTIAIAVLVGATAAGAVSAANSSSRALERCKPVTAGGKTWQVGVTAKLGCATARSIVSRVAVRRPDQVTRGRGGELDRFRASFSGLNCFRSRQAKVGGEIQCTSVDGAETVLATWRP